MFRNFLFIPEYTRKGRTYGRYFRILWGEWGRWGWGLRGGGKVWNRDLVVLGRGREWEWTMNLKCCVTNEYVKLFLESISLA